MVPEGSGQTRWRELNDLIEYWMRVAKDNLTRDLADEIGRESLDKSFERQAAAGLLERFLQRVRKHFEATSSTSRSTSCSRS